jgi:hypothetical protein
MKRGPRAAVTAMISVSTPAARRAAAAQRSVIAWVVLPLISRRRMTFSYRPRCGGSIGVGDPFRQRIGEPDRRLRMRAPERAGARLTRP